MSSWFLFSMNNRHHYFSNCLKEPFSFRYGFELSPFLITTLRMIISGLGGPNAFLLPFLLRIFLSWKENKKISRTFLYNIAFQLTLKSKSLKKTRKTEERKSRAGPQLYKFAIPLPSSSDRELPRNKESPRKLFCDPPFDHEILASPESIFFWELFEISRNFECPGMSYWTQFCTWPQEITPFHFPKYSLDLKRSHHSIEIVGNRGI